MKRLFLAVVMLTAVAFGQGISPVIGNDVIPGVAGNCGKYAANGVQITDAGSPCGGGGSMTYPGIGIPYTSDRKRHV